MAHASTEGHAVSHRIGWSGIWQTIMTALERIAESNTRVRRVEALQALSNEELATRGLKREDIVRHVYGDIFYV